MSAEDLIVDLGAPDTFVLPPQTIIDQRIRSDLESATRLAAMVSDWWRGHWRPLWADVVTSRQAGYGHRSLSLSRYPAWELPAVAPVVLEVAGDVFDTDLYRVAGHCRNTLDRELCWPWTTRAEGGPAPAPVGGQEANSLQVGPYRGGYITPGEIATWAADVEWSPRASTSVGGVAHGWARTTDTSGLGAFEVTGGSGPVAIEPTWPTADGDSVTADGVTFTLRAHAAELPVLYVTASLVVARALAVMEASGECKDHEGFEAKAMALIRGAC